MRQFLAKTTQILLLSFLIACCNTAFAQQKRITGGYVLTHEHPMNAMAFGGNYAFAGAPGNYRNGIMVRGYTAEGGGCKPGQRCDHGEVKGNLTASFIAGKSLGRDMGDHASHMGPRHDSFSHMRYSTEWILDAFDPSEREFRDSRMKIFIAFAVENQVMCEMLYDANKGAGGPGGNGYPCSRGDSLASLERQLDAMKAWVKENSSRMEIAYSAADARRIANAGKLVIILGIESEYSFGAENRTFDPVDRLQRFYDQGVRTFYLAHKINSRLTGADIYYPGNTTTGKLIRANQAISGCLYYDDNVGDFPLRNDWGHDFCDNQKKCGANHFRGNKLFGLTDKCVGKFSDISEFNTADYAVVRGNGTFNGFRIYPSTPGFIDPGGSEVLRSEHGDMIERNKLGLSHDGERVVRAAMLKGMIVNIDHISSRARVQMRAISEAFGDYPLNALHNNPNAMLRGSKISAKSLAMPFPHEYDFDDSELQMIKDTGGFFGVRLGPLNAKENIVDSGVVDDCPGTATENAKILAYLVDFGLSIGYSADYATITEGVHSRTMEECRLTSGAADNFHRYNGHVTEGLSHVGMMKKWHAELAAVGLKREYLRKLKNDGAEDFIRMWERSERKSKVGSQIPRQTFASNLIQGRTCEEDSNCPNRDFCAAGLPGVADKCRPKREIGGLCTDGRQCLSGRCSGIMCARAHQCARNADCAAAEYCGKPIAGRRTCKALFALGRACTKKDQCASGRCAWGRCATADECRRNSDCAGNRYCGKPISGRRTCKAALALGNACTRKDQCTSGRCAWGRCATADECRRNSDCAANQHCGNPVSGRRTCKALLAHGQACTKKEQCGTGRCAWGRCADADECRQDSDCASSRYCGNPVSGKRTCKVKLSLDRLCTKGPQCQTGCCKPHIKRAGAPICRPANKC